MMTFDMMKFEYFQKSTAFLAPLLGLDHTKNQLPLNTYLELADFEFKSTTPLIVIYYSQDPRFKETLNLLMNNPRYEMDLRLPDNNHLVIFDMSNLQEDYNKILEGKYSELSDQSKTIIKSRVPANHLIVMSLDPEKNKKHVAESLEVNESDLPKELLSPPKMELSGEILAIPYGSLIELRSLYQNS